MKNHFSDHELHLEDAEPQEKVCMWHLRDKILNPVREELGKITCSSGHRNKEHNIKVGGSETSHHLCTRGYAAADLVPSECSLEKLFEHIKVKYKYAELILEYDQNVVHVSMNINPKYNVNETWKRKLVNGKKKYY